MADMTYSQQPGDGYIPRAQGPVQMLSLTDANAGALSRDVLLITNEQRCSTQAEGKIGLNRCGQKGSENTVKMSF